MSSSKVEYYDLVSRDVAENSESSELISLAWASLRVWSAVSSLKRYCIRFDSQPHQFIWIISKKIKMDKLLKYINQYCEEAQIKWRRYRTNDWIMYDNRWELQSEALAICKNYRFISRLVENDKIKSTIWFENYNGWTLSFKRELVSKKHENIIRTHTILMILSIQDNPLKFLSELLK